MNIVKITNNFSIMDVLVCNNCNETIALSNTKRHYKVTDTDDCNNYQYCTRCRVKKRSTRDTSYRHRSMEIIDDDTSTDSD